VKGSSSSAQSQQQGSKNAGAKSGQIANEALFIRTVTNKSKVYEGEQVMLTHKVYTNTGLVGFNDSKMPSYTGFWAQEPPMPSRYSITEENIDGVKYSVVEFKKCFFFRNGVEL